MIYDYGGTNLTLYNYVLYDDSVKAVSNAMKVNLGLKSDKEIKSFSFNINNPYEEEVIGQKNTSKTSLVLLPSFIGKSLSYVNSFCGSNGIKVNVTGDNSGTVTAQSVPAGANVEDVRSINITLSSGKTTTTTVEDKTTKDDTTKKEEKNDDKTGDDNTKTSEDPNPKTEEETLSDATGAPTQP